MDNDTNMASRYEYDIPDGYEAQIEGNKVVIKLQESDDENIRKEAISIIRQYNNICEKEGDKCEIVDKVIAWLEKQGEQKNADRRVLPKFKVGDKIKLSKEPKYPARKIIAIKNNAYYFDELVHLPFNHQDEWELVEWPNLSNCKHDCKSCFANCLYRKEENPDLNFQNQCPWTEKDQKRVDRLVEILYNMEMESNDMGKYADLTVWLNGLCVKYGYIPQKQWKPSDEQMKAFYRYVNEGDRNLTISESVLLRHLFNDLKKLKE